MKPLQIIIPIIAIIVVGVSTFFIGVNKAWRNSHADTYTSDINGLKFINTTSTNINHSQINNSAIYVISISMINTTNNNIEIKATDFQITRRMILQTKEEYINVRYIQTPPTTTTIISAHQGITIPLHLKTAFTANKFFEVYLIYQGRPVHRMIYN